MPLSSTLLAILGVLSPPITSAPQEEILCNRNTTDTTCLSPTIFAYCNAWNALGPAINCESGTVCRESRTNGVSRIACLPDSITDTYDVDLDRPGMGLQCARQTTESLCVSGSGYSLCMSNGELSWPTECSGECRQWVFGMVTRAYCDSDSSEYDPMTPPTQIAQIPGGSCDNQSQDTICLTSRTFAKCYANDEIGNEHDCPTDSRCVDQTVWGVNRVLCERGETKSVYGLLGGSVLFDWTAEIFGRVNEGAGSRCDKTECFDMESYSVCFADGRKSVPMRCPEGSTCVELEEGGATCELIDEDEHESDEDEESNHGDRRLHERCETCVVVTSTATAIETATATTTASRPVYVVTEIVTASPVIVTVTATSTTQESVTGTGYTGCGSEPTCGSSGGSGGCESGCPGGSDDSGGSHGSNDGPGDHGGCDSGCGSGDSGGCESGCGSAGSGGCHSGCASGGSGGGERCDPSKMEGMCKDSQSFVQCLSDGSLSEPMSCAEGTVCKGTTVNGVGRAVCWWPAPDESAAIKPGDYCEANWVDSMCVSYCTFAKCFSVNLVGPVQACGEGTTCIESTANGKKSVTCGWPDHKVFQKRDGSGNPNIFPGFSMTTEVDVGRPCNNANVWSVCKNSTTYLECWPGGVFGPYRTCGIGTVCYEQDTGGHTGVYCGWPKAGSNQIPAQIPGDNTMGIAPGTGTTVTVYSTVVAVRRLDSTPTLTKRDEDEGEVETGEETPSESESDEGGENEPLSRRQDVTGPTVAPTTFPVGDPTAPPIQSTAATTAPPSQGNNGGATAPPPQSSETNYPGKPCDINKIRNVCMNARTFLTCISDGTLEEPRDCAEGTVCYNMYDAPDGLLDILCDFENLLGEPGISGLQLVGVLMDSPTILRSAVSTVVVTVTAPQETIVSTVIVTTTVISNVVTVTSTAVETAFATAAAVATAIVTEVVTMNVS
ncbi:hypothetical protein BJ742DRAFT_841507 [Cladochytrium replicatum]|nr:hypothetical protein BJ742DRAFT_841507 [Cladochytrium replicatum]